MYYYDKYSDNINDEDVTVGILKKHDGNYMVNNVEVKNNRGIINDIVYIKENRVINIKDRSVQKIAGILYMNKNEKYGKNSKNMMYYKFRALNGDFMDFLVPCSKKCKLKMYVVISFNKWEIDSKYPIGKCEHIVGELGKRENEYEILLYKYDLRYPKLKIKKENINDDLLSCENLDIDYNIFTIDPCGCKDIDDGIHIERTDKYVEIGVHITDVSYYMEKYVYDMMNNLTSSVYYDNKQINMIPEIYATNICSLLENNIRKCISVIYRYNEGKLIDYKVRLSNVYVLKNWDYDDVDNIIERGERTYLKELSDFMEIMENKKLDSHKMIEIWMIRTNKLIGELLYNYDKKNTILRIHKEQKYKGIDDIEDNELRDFLRLKQTKSAIYDKDVDNPYHSGLNVNYYTHYTSPIRRIIDIINHINIKKYLLNKDIMYIDMKDIEHINRVNKRIKKMERDNRLLDVFYKIDCDKYRTSGYIIDFNVKMIKIYMKDIGLEYKKRIYDNKLDELCDVEIEDNILIINGEKKYKKYDVVNVMMYFIREEDKLENKVKLEII